MTPRQTQKNKTMYTYDAIISGYGPTGATLANLLGAMGMRVAVIEREKTIFAKPRAITADHEALRAFQAVALGEAILEGTCPHPGTDFVGVEGQVIKRFYPLPAPGPLGWEPTYMFYQPRLEGTLRTGVERFAKVDVQLNHKVMGYRQDAGQVAVDIEGPDGRQQTLHGRYLLACDGARSMVRTQMACEINDLDFDEWWVVVDVDLHSDIELPERCVQYCRPSRPGTYIVGPGQLRRWEIKVLPGESPEAFNDPAHLDAVLSTFVDTRGVDVQRVAIYRFHAVVAQQWRDGQVFLLGDAAHQMPPFLGQGLCAGVRDAYNLAWKLQAVMAGKADQTLLDSYCAERKPHVQQVVETAKAFGLIIGELDETAARVRDTRLEAELNAGTAPTIRQSFIPGLTAGLVDTNDAGVPRRGAGQLFPQPWVAGAGVPRMRLDDLVRGDFYLVCQSAEFARYGRRLLAASEHLFAATVVCLDPLVPAAESEGFIHCAEEGGWVSAWLKQQGVSAALARPDGFAYGAAADLASLEALVTRLDRSLSAQAETGALACE